jgi:hypothetical protein
VSDDLRPLAVFDVDGVLADVRHRLHHVERRPKDWDAFFAAAVDDPPLEQGVALARASAEDCEVVYVTGRPERCRADTLAWFARHGLPDGRLSMRSERDRRPARLAKPGLLRRTRRGPAGRGGRSTTTRRCARPTRRPATASCGPTGMGGGTRAGAGAGGTRAGP